MSWTTGTRVDGWNTVLYVQAAGVTASAGTADQVPYGTQFNWSTARTVVSRGPHLNKQALTKSVGGVNYSGNFAIDLHSTANTVRNSIMSAVNAGTKLKITLRIGGVTSGEIYVWDQCICSQDGAVDPSATAVYTFNWEADSLTYTPGTAFA